MRSKLGILFMCLGTVLLIMALSLFLYNNAQAREAQQYGRQIMPQLIQRIEEELQEPQEETLPIVIPGTPEELLDPSVFEMTEVEINRYSYIGYLSIPELNLDLPVMSDWSYRKLEIAPCRYSGTLGGNDLVIMAHNYGTHFGLLQYLKEDSKIIFTDMDGITTHYKVVATEVLSPTAVEDMIAGEFDLTLFTCTLGGRSRIALRCDRLIP